MLELFKEGGFGMHPVLVFGLLLIGTAARYAWDGEPVRLRFALAMGAVLIVSVINATVTDVGTVLGRVADPALTPDGQIARTLFTGLKESTRPGALGGMLLTVALILIAIGVYRGTRRELRAAEA